jgi:prenyl protein peptidase
VTPALFLGPLYGRYLSRDLPLMARWTFNEQVKDTFDWVGIRNYIVVSATDDPGRII